MNFKAFERFTLQFGSTAYLVGPNNAGKSTVVSALRSCAYMIRYASARSPERSEFDNGSHVLAYSMESVRLDLDLDNLRHEFRDEETRLSLRFSDGASLHAVWPKPSVSREEEEDSEEDYDFDDDVQPEAPFGYFYIRFRDGSQPRRPSEVKRGLPSIGVIPVLAPIPSRESLLSREHIRSNMDRRLSSDHFRNHLYWLDRDVVPFASFQEEVHRWLPELTVTELRESGGELDVFFEEVGAHATKEISWAGDGVQVWMQLVLHLLRTDGMDAVVLDEPEVFLHPDLQRRLVRLLSAQSPQVITSSHSAEILSEAPPESVLWVDKSRRKAIKAPPDPLLSQLARALGIEFNLRLARALKTRVALFVEGDDMSIIRHLAKTRGAERVAEELGVAEVSINGFANWPQVQAFGWLTRDLLDDSVVSFVVLDGDYRSSEANAVLRQKLSDVGVRPHIWQRKELESYLIDSNVIARAAGSEPATVEELLLEIAGDMKTTIQTRRVYEEQSRLKSSGDHPVTIAERVTLEFEQEWKDPMSRVWMCPAKDLLSTLNARLQTAGCAAVSARGLAQEMRADELPYEIGILLDEVERAAAELI